MKYQITKEQEAKQRIVEILTSKTGGNLQLQNNSMMQESVLIDNRQGSLMTPVMIPDVTMEDVNPNHEELIIIIDQAQSAI